MSIGLSILYIFRFENLFHFQALGIITLQWCKLVNLLNLISNFRHCKLIQKAFKFVICYWLKPVANLIFQKNKKKTKQEIVIFTTNFLCSALVYFCPFTSFVHCWGTCVWSCIKVLVLVEYVPSVLQDILHFLY